MRRRLPFEPEQFVAQLTSWIEWRHAESKDHLVLTSAPTSVPPILERWMPGAVWRLAWLGNGAAILYGLAPSSGPGKYFVVKHDAVNARREGVFESLPDGTWSPVEGDSLQPDAKSALRIENALFRSQRRPPRRRSLSNSDRHRLQRAV
jgi:hypothetical protein